MLGRTVEARALRHGGDQGQVRARSGTTTDGKLVKAVVLTRGETLNYELAA